MKTYQYIALAALALSFAACSQEDDFTPQGNQKDSPITIASTGVAELSTRAITNGKLVGVADGESATMGVFVTGGSETKYNATNMQCTHDGTSWHSETDVLFEGIDSQQKIYACSPYTTVTDNNITVTATDQTDWLVTTSNSLTSSVVNLTMTHALAKLVLKPTYGTEVEESQRNIAKVEVGDMYASGTLNISDNKWSNQPEANATLEMKNNEVLIIPMAQCTSFPITITMDDNRMFKTTISLATVDNKLEAGTQYNIGLQIGQDKVTIELVSMDDIDSPFGGGWNSEKDLN